MEKFYWILKWPLSYLFCPTYSFKQNTFPFFPYCFLCYCDNWETHLSLDGILSHLALMFPQCCIGLQCTPSQDSIICGAGNNFHLTHICWGIHPCLQETNLPNVVIAHLFLSVLIMDCTHFGEITHTWLQYCWKCLAVISRENKLHAVRFKQSPSILLGTYSNAKNWLLFLWKYVYREDIQKHWLKLQNDLSDVEIKIYHEIQSTKSNLMEELKHTIESGVFRLGCRF